MSETERLINEYDPDTLIALTPNYGGGVRVMGTSLVNKELQKYNQLKPVLDAVKCMIQDYFDNNTDVDDDDEGYKLICSVAEELGMDITVHRTLSAKITFEVEGNFPKEFSEADVLNDISLFWNNTYLSFDTNYAKFE